MQQIYILVYLKKKKGTKSQISLNYQVHEAFAVQSEKCGVNLDALSDEEADGGFFCATTCCLKGPQ